MCLFRVAKPKLNLRPFFSKTPFFGPAFDGTEFLPENTAIQSRTQQEEATGKSQIRKSSLHVKQLNTHVK